MMYKVVACQFDLQREAKLKDLLHALQRAKEEGSEIQMNWMKQGTIRLLEAERNGYRISTTLRLEILRGLDCLFDKLSIKEKERLLELGYPSKKESEWSPFIWVGVASLLIANYQYLRIGIGMLNLMIGLGMLKTFQEMVIKPYQKEELRLLLASKLLVLDEEYGGVGVKANQNLRPNQRICFYPTAEYDKSREIKDGDLRQAGIWVPNGHKFLTRSSGSITDYLKDRISRRNGTATPVSSKWAGPLINDGVMSGGVEKSFQELRRVVAKTPMQEHCVRKQLEEFCIQYKNNRGSQRNNCGQVEQLGQLVMVASRKIEKGEFLGWEYGVDYWCGSLIRGLLVKGEYKNAFELSSIMDVACKVPVEAFNCSSFSDNNNDFVTQLLTCVNERRINAQMRSGIHVTLQIILFSGIFEGHLEYDMAFEKKTPALKEKLQDIFGTLFNEMMKIVNKLELPELDEVEKMWVAILACLVKTIRSDKGPFPSSVILRFIESQIIKFYDGQVDPETKENKEVKMFLGESCIPIGFISQ